MRRVILLLIFYCCWMVGSVDAQGIQFREVGFEENQAEAEKQDKLIFIDFYTTWCGPCKLLAKNVFMRPEVWAYFNRMFVNCKLDAEREGKELAKKYGVESFPTLLFVNAAGEVINKLVGMVSVETLLAAGEKALADANDPDNVTNLKKRYQSGERSEQFLKMYIGKMVDCKEDPGEALEECLKVQTSMKESSSRMMEFFIKYSDFFLLGGEAERIFQANRDEYMDIATRKEEREVKQVFHKMMKRTQATALQNKDVEQYELFVQRWLALPEKPYYQDYNDLRLDLLLLKGEMKAYKELAVVYLDSIVDSRLVEDIHKVDKERYEEYCESNSGIGPYADMMKKSYENLDAKLQVKAILKVGNELVNNARRKDFKRFSKWIEHGKLLLPDDYRMYNFEANVLYYQGKRERAIELKKKVLDMVGTSAKIYPSVKKGLENMEAGIFGESVK